ncbi:hypothetical protein RE9427_41040 [Prescottella equi]|nr:hypothetical protein RE9427_41040 [Prescottella equi]
MFPNHVEYERLTAPGAAADEHECGRVRADGVEEALRPAHSGQDVGARRAGGGSGPHRLLPDQQAGHRIHDRTDDTADDSTDAVQDRADTVADSLCGITESGADLRGGGALDRSGCGASTGRRRRDVV